MTTRICILGLPRSGSHYVVELLCRSYFNQGIIVTDLKEPFNIDDPITIEVTNHLIHAEYKSGATHGKKQFESVATLINNRIDQINKSSTDQNVILRLFPFDYLESHINNIVNCLQKNNFKFIVLTRQNIEQQLLSYGRAVATNSWVGEPNSTIIEFTEKSFSYMKWLYNRILKFSSIINDLGIECTSIKYENCINDIEQHFKIRVVKEVKIKKQSIDEPYDLISNSDQVRVFIKNLVGVNFELR